MKEQNKMQTFILRPIFHKVDAIYCNSCMVLSMFFMDSCPTEDTWYGVILWVLRVLGHGLKSELSLVVAPY